MNGSKHVIVAPLDWGIGHATRMIPVIHYLLSKNISVTMAAGTRTLKVLHLEFPTLTTITLSTISPRYCKIGWLTNLYLLIQSPSIFVKSAVDRIVIYRFIKSNNVDLLISDNRISLFGLTKKSIYVTHQWNIKTGDSNAIFEKIVSKTHQYFAKKFTKIMIPDFESEQNLAGALSHPALCGQIFYCGALSRFVRTNEMSGSDVEPYILAVLSGPEPHRTILENIIVNQSKSINQKVVLVRGVISTKTTLNVPANVTVYDFLHGAALQKLIIDAHFIICRSGYTSIMDLICLSKRALLIPTPGQFEQIYLAKHLDNLKLFPSIDQNNFELSQVLQIIENYPFCKVDFESPDFSEIEKLLC